MQIISRLSLELCRTCQGQGILGQADGYNIVCEHCAGTGLYALLSEVQEKGEDDG